MKKVLIICILFINIFANAQVKAKKLNSLEVSIPLIANNSKALSYTLGSPNYPSGTALSYGINFSYSRIIYKNFFATVGLGYFKQQFAIKRWLNYQNPNGNKILYGSTSYLYNNINSMIGLGYLERVKKNFIIKEWVCYNSYNSFNQRYKNPSIHPSENKNFSIGYQLAANIGFEKELKNNFSVGANLIFPFYTRWNKDNFFTYNYYSDDEQKIAYNIFSIGISINCNYNF